METLLNFEAPQKPQGTSQKNMVIAAIREEMNHAIKILRDNLEKLDENSGEWVETESRIKKIEAAAAQLDHLNIQDLKHLQAIYKLPIAGKSHEPIARN